MTKQQTDLMQRFTSRKFLLTVAGALFAIIAHEFNIGEDVVDSVVKLITIFVGFEGFADAVQRYKKG